MAPPSAVVAVAAGGPSALAAASLAGLGAVLRGGQPGLAAAVSGVDDRHGLGCPTGQMGFQRGFGLVSRALVEHKTLLLAAPNNYFVNAKFFIKHCSHLWYYYTLSSDRCQVLNEKFRGGANARGAALRGLRYARPPRLRQGSNLGGFKGAPVVLRSGLPLRGCPLSAHQSALRLFCSVRGYPSLRKKGRECDVSHISILTTNTMYGTIQAYDIYKSTEKGGTVNGYAE